MVNGKPEPHTEATQSSNRNLFKSIIYLEYSVSDDKGGRILNWGFM